jgi:hypothetical protein
MGKTFIIGLTFEIAIINLGSVSKFMPVERRLGKSS